MSFTVLANWLQFIQGFPLIETGAVGLNVLLVMLGPLQAIAWDHGCLDRPLAAAMQRLQYWPDSSEKEQDKKEFQDNRNII